MDDNKHNLLYFEAESVRGLFEQMAEWQSENRKRFLSVSIHPDQHGLFSCLALTNPMEVVIECGSGHSQALVAGSALKTYIDDL